MVKCPLFAVQPLHGVHHGDRPSLWRRHSEPGRVCDAWVRVTALLWLRKAMGYGIAWGNPGWIVVGLDGFRWVWKSRTTLDGWNPIKNGINHLSTGAGFLPSTVGSDWLATLGDGWHWRKEKGETNGKTRMLGLDRLKVRWDVAVFFLHVIVWNLWLFLFDYLATCVVEVVVIMFGLNEGDNCWGGQTFYV